MIDTLRNLAPIRWAAVHPRIAAWIVLSAGMIILLVIEASSVGLLFGQWIALIAAVILVAGACVWIISWEDAEEPPTGAPEAISAVPEAPVAAAAAPDLPASPDETPVP